MTKEEVSARLVLVIEQTEKVPTRLEFCTIAKISKSTIAKAFGSYSAMLEELDLQNKNKFIPIATKCNNTNCTNIFHTTVDNKNKRYCSRSCSNSAEPRRKAVVNSYQISRYQNKGIRETIYIKPICLNCNQEHSRESSFCSTICKTEHRFKNTLLKNCYCNGAMANKYRVIRDSAKNYSKHFIGTVCQNCGYNKHIEIAHIKPIKDFNENDTLWDVNNSTNLMALCPNCHWEFDSGNLTLEQIMQ